LARRIILIRHGESAGNIDETLYARVPDHLVPLTERGKQQARAAAVELKQYVTGPISFFVSPYERSVQLILLVVINLICLPRRTRGTYRELRAVLGASCRIASVREEPRLREQEFGNFQDPTVQGHINNQRRAYGRFFYRVPSGESGADVYDRVSTFFDTLFRSFKRRDFDADAATVVIVTHGLTLRLFLMRFFHWSVEQFERTANPPNCGFVVMERVAGARFHEPGTYRLLPESAAVVGLTDSECADADLAEAADRAAAGTPAIHRPVIAEGAGEEPVPPALAAQLRTPQPAGAVPGPVVGAGVSSEAAGLDVSYTHALHRLEMERHVLPAAPEASAPLPLHPGQSFGHADGAAPGTSSSQAHDSESRTPGRLAAMAAGLLWHPS
jgi:broad specificity phosphatase PhoE